MSKKICSLLLMFILTVSTASASFADYYSDLLPAVKTIPGSSGDYAEKTAA